LLSSRQSEALKALPAHHLDLGPAYGLEERQRELAAVDRPLIRLGRAVLSSLSFKGGYLRLEFRNGPALTLRLVRELPQTLQDLADEVLGPCVGVHDADLLG
jgi:hypothetical protein